MLRHWPHMLLATAFVVLGPLAVVWMLPVAGTTTILLSVGISMLLSMSAVELGARIWRTQAGATDMVFADLLLWGWVRRLRTERELARLAGVEAGRGEEPADRVRALTRMSELLEARDVYTRRHSTRVARHAVGIGQAMGLNPKEIEQVRTAALLHDVGKICTPREILTKPARLTAAEWTVVRRHPGQGADLLVGLLDPETVAMVRHHHERLSGHGYPSGLRGVTIPLGARIIAVADTFDAMTSPRPHRAARSHDETIRTLREQAGRELDGDVIRGFLAYYTGRDRLDAWAVSTGMISTINPIRQILTQVGTSTAAVAVAASGAVALPVAAATTTTTADPAPRQAPPSRPVPERKAVARSVAVRELAQHLQPLTPSEAPSTTHTDSSHGATAPARRRPHPQPRRPHRRPRAPVATVPATPGPAGTAAPVASPSPVPAATAEPVTTASPGPAPKPEKTPKPQPTPKPEKTPKPAPTPKPEKTPKPAPTPKPERTPKPAPTPKPEKTPKPAPTPKPAKTPKPEKTPKP